MSTLPVVEIPAYPGTSVQAGALAAVRVASAMPTLDLRELPNPPHQVRAASVLPTP